MTRRPSVAATYFRRQAIEARQPAQPPVPELYHRQRLTRRQGRIVERVRELDWQERATRYLVHQAIEIEKDLTVIVAHAYREVTGELHILKQLPELALEQNRAVAAFFEQQLQPAFSDGLISLYIAGQDRL